MDAVLSRATRVDVTAGREGQTEVVTAGKLNDPTSRLERDLGECGVDKVARGLSFFQSLFNEANLAVTCQSTTVDGSLIREKQRVVTATGKGFNFEAKIHLAWTRHKGNLVTTVIQEYSVCLSSRIPRFRVNYFPECAVVVRFGAFLGEGGWTEINSSLVTHTFLENVHLPKGKV